MVINESKLPMFMVIQEDFLYAAHCFILLAFYVVCFDSANWKKRSDHKLIDPFIFIIETRVSSCEREFISINFLRSLFARCLWFFRFAFAVHKFRVHVVVVVSILCEAILMTVFGASFDGFWQSQAVIRNLSLSISLTSDAFKALRLSKL